MCITLPNTCPGEDWVESYVRAMCYSIFYVSESVCFPAFTPSPSSSPQKVECWAESSPVNGFELRSPVPQGEPFSQRRKQRLPVSTPRAPQEDAEEAAVSETP